MCNAIGVATATKKQSGCFYLAVMHNPIMEKPNPSEALNRFMKDQGLRNEDLAAACGVAFSTVNRWKNGGVPSTKALREALERVTKGAIPASLWNEKLEQRNAKRYKGRKKKIEKRESACGR